MDHPYRCDAHVAPETISPCLVCRMRVLLAPVRWQRILVGAGAFAFLSFNVATAALAGTYAQLAQAGARASLAEKPLHGVSRRAERPARPPVATASVPAVPVQATESPTGIAVLRTIEIDVDRAAFERALEHDDDLARSARVLPEEEAGDVVGVRLFGVRPGSLLAQLGFENGDRVETVNGFGVTSPERALDAYARLGTASHVVVGLRRRGSKVELDYNVR